MAQAILAQAIFALGGLVLTTVFLHVGSTGGPGWNKNQTFQNIQKSASPRAFFEYFEKFDSLIPQSSWRQWMSEVPVASRSMGCSACRWTGTLVGPASALRGKLADKKLVAPVEMPVMSRTRSTSLLRRNPASSRTRSLLLLRRSLVRA